MFDYTVVFSLEENGKGVINAVTFEIFKLKYFEKGSSKNFNSGDIFLRINFSPEFH